MPSNEELREQRIYSAQLLTLFLLLKMAWFDSENYKLSNCSQRYFDLENAELKLSQNSISKYEEISEKLIELIGDIDVRKISDRTIIEIKKHLNEPIVISNEKRFRSPARKNHYLVVLRNILKFLREREEIQSIYDYNRIKKFKEESKPVEFLTDEEVQILINSIKESCITKLRLKTLIICLLSTGARISEMLSLNKDDIDWESGVVNVRGKGGKMNQIIFNDLSREYLKKYLDRRTDDCPALLATTSGTRWQVNCSERAMRNQGKRAGIKKRIYCHLFRKTAASKMFFSGAPLPVVSKFLSHSDLATTQKYYLRGANFEEVKQYHNALDYSHLVNRQE